ncbi:MAG: tRNA dihydrouridine synthase DusB [Caldiserica bacterium CG02_land_8_20_14_3_00_36_38]|nr:tRNA dihydrouridine synthase DusB [Caldisericota bacterium]NCQ53448.1 tRNA dihydrouridine synthase DusB [Caldisericota bacterium]PIP49992.1 MAG: tRNA dihydrouridine synthase DusB [Caldiserica bacterium CG23_combo_of_CG06-09_8_20_14_all_35_60]PIV55742.1 MAG: tRNA dihydrouridine synthase DusB [Caldiserica bacterium CG02_land_8_20_14_3_00_36_38]PIW10445.1 MAG: tRNA dihydrouridine synthase DusB [Caldiserica bacterium CG17_big_fil_post_rev_8_21_14_2_50_35_7]
MNMLRSFKIGNVQIDPPIVLAPIAGFTDSPFRILVKNFTAGLVYTEMISSMGVFFKDAKTFELIKFKENEKPVSAQIFGNDPDKLAYAASYLEEKGFDIIDINMGCPANKIVSSGAGSALLKNPGLVKKIVQAVRTAVKIPLTVKLRKGFSSGENVLFELSHIIESEGADAIIIHGITVEDGFKKDKEDWESIRQVKETVSVPVIGNGGIIKETDVKNMFEITGVDGVMAGRACIGEPWFIKSAIQFIDTGIPLSLLLSEKLNIIVKLVEMEIDEKGEENAIKEMRKFIQSFTFGMRGVAALRDKVNKVGKKDELMGLLRAFFEVKEAAV